MLSLGAYYCFPILALRLTYYWIFIMSKYNGWTNRETWLINAWFNPESRLDVEVAKEHMESDIEALPGYLKDMIDVDCINWEELKDYCEEE